jgi:hypothetical protein
MLWARHGRREGKTGCKIDARACTWSSDLLVSPTRRLHLPIDAFPSTSLFRHDGDNCETIQNDWRGHVEGAHRENRACSFIVLLTFALGLPTTNRTSDCTQQNAELFALTYGALVVQLIQDYEDYAEVNKQLEKMGYNIGTRLIEDFLARSNLGRCADFREVGEVVAKVSFQLNKIEFLINKQSNLIRLGSNPF